MSLKHTKVKHYNFHEVKKTVTCQLSAYFSSPKRKNSYKRNHKCFGVNSNSSKSYFVPVRAMVSSETKFLVTHELISFSETLAELAGTIIGQYFRLPIQIQTKLDKSPVTIADEEVEATIKREIRKRYPEHDILGEEGGLDRGTGKGDLVWVIDPIDGTASFITGKPLFGVLIALLYKGVPVLGILDQPILKERWIGIKDGESFQTTLNNEPIKVRSCAEISSAYLYSTSPHLFSGQSEIAFTKLRNSVKRTNYGCDCYAFGLLSLGFVDLVVEDGMKPWDYLALVPIVEGAGGIFTDWKGNPLRIDPRRPETWPGDCLAAGDEATHAEAVKILSGSEKNE